MAGNVEPAFSLGIEEEYLLVDLATRDLVADPPAELLQRCIAETEGRGHVVGARHPDAGGEDLFLVDRSANASEVTDGLRPLAVA